MNLPSLARSSLVLITLALVGGAGCKDDPPPAQPEVPTSASANAASARSKLPIRPPMGPVARMDPLSMKEYRVDVCYFGTLTLKQARDSYLASLAGAEPSEKKLPNFGVPIPVAPVAATSAAPSSGPPPSLTPPPPRPAGSGSAAAAAAIAPGKLDFTIRAAYERNARTCTAAATLKEPSMGDVDPALQEFAAFAIEVAKDISTTTDYYAKETYKKDKFEQGKALHKKLVEEFAKVDAMSDKLGGVIATYRAAHKPDAAKQEEAEKMSLELFENARAAMLALVPAKKDLAAFKEAEGKLAASIEALKKFGNEHTGDTWSKLLVGPAEAYAKVAKDTEAKVTEKGIDAEAFVTIIGAFGSMIEAKQRAVTRAMMTKNLPSPVPAVAAPAPSASAH